MSDAETPSEAEATQISLSGDQVRSIAKWVVIAILLIATSGIAALCFSGAEASASIVAIVASSVSAAGAVASSLFSLRAVAESGSNLQRAIEAAESGERNSRREALLAEFDEIASQGGRPTRSQLFSARKNRITFSEVAERTGISEDEVRGIFSSK